MKMQIEGDRLRLRMSETELARLGEDGELRQGWPCPDGQQAHCVLELHGGATESRCEGNLMELRVMLPRTAFLAFAAECPRRDGFSFVHSAIRVSVEVDVRDSHRVRRTVAQPGKSASI